MRYIEVTVNTPGAEIDARCQEMADMGAGGFVIENEEDFKDFLEQNHQYWDYVDDELENQFAGVSRIKCYLTDDEDGLRKTADFIRSLNTVQRVEVLPYHTLGLFKWQKLGIPYPLPDAVPPTAEQVQRAEELLEVSRYPG